jgi:hypothetical protein
VLPDGVKHRRPKTGATDAVHREPVRLSAADRNSSPEPPIRVQVAVLDSVGGRYFLHPPGQNGAFPAPATCANRHLAAQELFDAVCVSDGMPDNRGRGDGQDRSDAAPVTAARSANVRREGERRGGRANFVEVAKKSMRVGDER